LKFLIIAVLLKSLMCIFYLPTVPTYHVSVNRVPTNPYIYIYIYIGLAVTKTQARKSNNGMCTQ
jgi:hypothetical protein